VVVAALAAGAVLCAKSALDAASEDSNTAYFI
jgi:hypothetical protein